jgi:hypothetical protein
MPGIAMDGSEDLPNDDSTPSRSNVNSTRIDISDVSEQSAAEFLAAAISDMGVNCGMIRADADLTGPHLLMICGDMVSVNKLQCDLIDDLRAELNSLTAPARTEHYVDKTTVVLRSKIESLLRNLEQDKIVNGSGLFEPYIAQVRPLLERTPRANTGETKSEQFDQIASLLEKRGGGSYAPVKQVENLLLELKHYDTSRPNVQSQMIADERRLCKALGLDWSPNVNIDTLCHRVEELVARSKKIQ